MASSSPATKLEAIPFIDLAAQQARIRDRIDRAIARVLDHGAYIMGPEVGELESRLAQYSGARHVITCASGTDALLIIMMAIGLGPGDAVICPAFTYTATPETAALLGATPVFADVRQDDFNLDTDRLKGALDAALRAHLKPRAVLAVDLFGLPADYDGIGRFAAEHGLFVIADAAQSFGASYKGRRVGGLGFTTATSFFPAKPLGCYGDGGAILTDDDQLASVMRSIRLHGKGADKYDVVRIGINGRLDTLQAAILIEKLAIFEDELAARCRIAATYGDGLGAFVAVPRQSNNATSVWAQYTLRLPAGRRDAIAAELAARGIPTAVYYPRGLHEQPAFRTAPIATGGLPVATRLPREVLSLPMHPYLDPMTQSRIIAEVCALMGG